MNCINCEKKLEPLIEGREDNFQFENALDIQIRLGYGEFADAEPNRDNAPRACLCMHCAASLIVAFPGIRKMVEGYP